MAIASFTSPGIAQWLCPAGVFSAAVACWGGGAPGQAGSSFSAGRGGAGAEYAAEPLVAVTPGTVYKLAVASASGASYFIGDTLTVTAHGATGSNPGTGSTNSAHHDGGGSGLGAGGAGGGGGSSAGTSAAGNAGSSASGGLGGAGGDAPAGGAAGGKGGDAIPGAPGANGGAPGAGGGGGATRNQGGKGGHGQVQITYAAPIQPQIPYFPAGYRPTNLDFDNWIKNPSAFLTSGKPLLRAELTTPLAMPSGTPVVIPFDSILEDPYAGWQSGPHQWLCPAGYPGMYAVSLSVSCAANPLQPVIAARVGLDGSTFAYAVDRAWVPPSVVPGIASGSQQVRLYGGLDSVQGLAYCAGSSGTTSVAAGTRCRLSVMWISL